MQWADDGLLDFVDHDTAEQFYDACESGKGRMSRSPWNFGGGPVM